MKKLFIQFLIAGCLSAALLPRLNAITIMPGQEVLSGNQTSQSQIDTAIAGTIGSSTELYKSNVGTGEEGPLAGSYNTTYANTPTDPSEATITYTGGPIVSPIAYLLVKDGNAMPAWYLFNLTNLGWTGTEILELTNFWPGSDTGAISHVALYGGSGGGQTGVPDGGATVVLLGSALVILGGIRRLGPRSLKF